MNDETSNPGKLFALIGAVLLTGPILGTAGTVIGMFRAMKTLGNSTVVTPEQLSAQISEVLLSTAIGLGIGLIGLVFICVALFGLRYRAKWLFWFLVAYGSLLLFVFPVGTASGMVIILFCTIQRQEFLVALPPKAGGTESPLP